MALKVMMIDDEESVLFALRLLMEALGYQVEVFASGLDALEKLKSGDPFDYLVCDLKMPEINGLDVLKEAKRLRPEVRRVLMSAHATDEEIKNRPKPRHRGLPRQAVYARGIKSDFGVNLFFFDLLSNQITEGHRATGIFHVLGHLFLLLASLNRFHA